MHLISITYVNRHEALRYLGYGDALPDENISRLIDECEKKLLETIKPRYLYRIFDISRMSDGIHLENCTLVLKGKDISEHLNDCKKIVLICATLSMDTDMLIRNAQINNMAEAVILNSLANVCIEQLCDEIELEIYERLPQYFYTWRYSAGYGDLPIEIQPEFVDIMNAQKRIGLCVTSSGMLTPEKSVTAVIGLSEVPLKSGKKGCQTCNMREKCQFRRKGERCGF